MQMCFDKITSQWNEMIVFLAFHWYTFSLDNTVPWSYMQNLPIKSNAISGRNNQFLKCFIMYHHVDLDFTILSAFNVWRIWRHKCKLQHVTCEIMMLKCEIMMLKCDFCILTYKTLMSICFLLIILYTCTSFMITCKIINNLSVSCHL